MTSGIKIIKNLNRTRRGIMRSLPDVRSTNEKLFETDWEAIVISFDQAKRDFVVSTVGPPQAGGRTQKAKRRKSK